VSSADALESFPSNWQPITDVVARLRQSLGGQSVAEHDVNDALTTGDLHCLYRYPTDYGLWKHQRVSFLCWSGHKLHYWSDGAVTAHLRHAADRPLVPRSAFDITRRRIPNGGARFPLPESIAIGAIGMRIRGVFYGWGPDLHRLWPAIFPPTDPRKDEGADDESDVDRLDAWLAELYANNEWRFLTAKEVHRDITARAKELTKKRGKLVPGLSYTVVRQGLKERRK
jgi:hypothetical protein